MSKVVQLREPDPFETISRRCEIIKRLALSLSNQVDQDQSAFLEPLQPDRELDRSELPQGWGDLIPFRPRGRKAP